MNTDRSVVIRVPGLAGLVERVRAGDQLEDLGEVVAVVVPDGSTPSLEQCSEPLGSGQAA